jgi:hypothetical protein
MLRYDRELCRHLRHPSGLQFGVEVFRMPRLERQTILAAFVAAPRFWVVDLRGPLFSSKIDTPAGVAETNVL